MGRSDRKLVGLCDAPRVRPTPHEVEGSSLFDGTFSFSLPFPDWVGFPRPLSTRPVPPNDVDLGDAVGAEELGGVYAVT